MLLLEDDGNVVYTADSDQNPTEKADYITGKYKERVKQSAFPKIYLPEDNITLSSSSSIDTDSSWERQELKSLLDTANNKSEKSKKTKNKKKDKKLTCKSDEVYTDSSWEKDKLKSLQNSAKNKPAKSKIKKTKKDKKLKSKGIMEPVSKQSSLVSQSVEEKGADELMDTFNLGEVNGQKNSREEVGAHLVSTYSQIGSKITGIMESTSKQISPVLADENGADDAFKDPVNLDEFNGQKNNSEHEYFGSERKQDEKYGDDEEKRRKTVEGSSQLITLTNKNKSKNNNEKLRDKSRSTSSDTQLILAALSGIAVTQQEILKKQEHHEEMLRTLFKKVGLIPNQASFVYANNLQLPFQDISDFADFNRKLNDEETFRTEFILSLHCLMDKDFNISKSVLNILKKYMSRNLAMQFTNVRKKPNKLILKDYRIHQCIIDAVTETHRGIHSEDGQNNYLEKNTSDAIGIVLCNARDWEKGRQERQGATSSRQDN